MATKKKIKNANDNNAIEVTSDTNVRFATDVSVYTKCLIDTCVSITNSTNKDIITKAITAYIEANYDTDTQRTINAISDIKCTNIINNANDINNTNDNVTK